jgi:hypothetical protein
MFKVRRHSGWIITVGVAGLVLFLAVTAANADATCKKVKGTFTLPAAERARV